MTEDRQSRYKDPVSAILTGITDLFRKRKPGLSLGDQDRLDGKKVLITGASSGLGFATAVEAAKRGAHVVMAVRSGIPGKGEAVRKKSGSARVEMVHVDLTDPGSFGPLAEQIVSRFGPLDVIICNAAVVNRQSRTCWGGLDEMFVVNYLSKFLLLNLLIEKGGLNHTGPGVPRIIIVNSESHRNPSQIEWEHFGTYRPYGIREAVAMYGYYKLLLLTMANELSRRLNGRGATRCSVFALCPGPVNSNIAREAPKVFKPLLRLVFWIFFRSPSKACRPILYLAASREEEGRPGDYLFLMDRKPMDGKATDPDNGKRLWQVTEKLLEHQFLQEGAEPFPSPVSGNRGD